MNTHHTKLKGDIAVARTIADLTQLGYFVFLPLSENGRYDLVADTGDELFRIQVKYCSDGEIPAKSSWTDRNGNHEIKYELTDFDLFAIYSPSLDRVLYADISCAGRKIAYEKPLGNARINWWEDFISFGRNKILARSLDPIARRNSKDNSCQSCDVPICRGSRFCISCSNSNRERISWPSDDSLKELVWTKPIIHLAKDLNISNKAIRKRCLKRDISMPPQGFWSSIKSRTF